MKYLAHEIRIALSVGTLLSEASDPKLINSYQEKQPYLDWITLALLSLLSMQSAYKVVCITIVFPRGSLSIEYSNETILLITPDSGT
jgi:hypothetical protein